MQVKAPAGVLTFWRVCHSTGLSSQHQVKPEGCSCFITHVSRPRVSQPITLHSPQTGLAGCSCLASTLNASGQHGSQSYKSLLPFPAPGLSLTLCAAGGFMGRQKISGNPACRGTFGGRRKAVRDRFAVQGGTRPSGVPRGPATSTGSLASQPP